MSLPPESIGWVRPLGIGHGHVLTNLSKKEMTKSRGRELRNTDFGMNDHFPSETNERREKNVSHHEGKVYINGQLYRDSRVTPWLF
jgi:hypothetical protein